MSQISSAESGPGYSGSAAASTSALVVEEPDARSSTGSPAIYTAGLAKKYGKLVAVRSLDMTVERGEVFGFLGPNGAGKTSVVKMLLGLVRPSGGEALVLGAPLGDRETRRRIGYLPELFRFQALLTAREVLALHCRLLALPRDSHDVRITRALETVGLTERGGSRVGSFSKGMQQRLGLGVALLGEPSLVVLDEPTSALDPIGRHDVREIIRQLRSEGMTVFLNTHLLSEAEQVCDRVAVIDKGVVVATGTLEDLRGTRRRVRIRLSGPVQGGVQGVLSSYGSWRSLDGWMEVDAVEPDRVADLVAELVAIGARIEAVLPEQKSLESRFLELLSER